MRAAILQAAEKRPELGKQYGRKVPLPYEKPETNQPHTASKLAGLLSCHAPFPFQTSKNAPANGSGQAIEDQAPKVIDRGRKAERRAPLAREVTCPALR